MEQIDLVNYYIGILNANTDGIVFVGGYLMQTADGRYQYVEYPNHYTETVVNYTPVTFEFVGETKRIPEKDITEWNMLVTMDLIGDYDTDTELVKQVNAVDLFKTTINDNPLTTLNGYKLTSNVSPITKEEGVARSGEKRIQVSFIISALSGKSVFYGNDITHSIALSGNTLQETFMLSTNIINGKTEQTEPDLTNVSGIAKTVIEDGTTRYDYSFLYDNSDLHNEIIKSIAAQNTNVNQKYDIEMSFPSIVISKTVVLSGGTLTITPNDLLIINVQFKETV